MIYRFEVYTLLYINVNGIEYTYSQTIPVMLPLTATEGTSMDSDGRLPLTLQAYHILKKKIMDLQLRPGEILLAKVLAAELGISRTPVREALVRLEREGFVEEAEGKKFRVSELTLAGVLEIHELRELLEEHAVRKMARSRSEEQIEELRNLVRQMEQALTTRDHDSFYAADLVFHATIVHYGGNRTLEGLMALLNEKIQRIRYLTLHIYGRLDETIGEHMQVLDAIVRKDPEGARKALHEHLVNVKSGVEKLFTEPGIGLLGAAYLNRS